MSDPNPLSYFAQRRLSRRALFRGAAVSGIGAAGLMVVGCGDDDDDDDNGSSTGSLLDRAREQGFIRVGIANEAPYGFATAAGEVTGEAPEVARAVLERLEIPEIIATVVPFGSLIPGLTAGRFDMIAAGMFITPDRCAEIVFSDPDYCVPQALGVAAGNPLGLTNYDDIAANPDARLGVIAGAIEETSYAPAAGIADGQIEAFADVNDLPEALAAGRIDAFAATTLSVREQIERVGGDIEATPGFVPVVDGEEQLGCGGYGFVTDDQEFRDAFNDVLVEMKENDEILPITEEFGFLEDEISAAQGVTAEQLCEA